MSLWEAIRNKCVAACYEQRCSLCHTPFVGSQLRASQADCALPLAMQPSWLALGSYLGLRHSPSTQSSQVAQSSQPTQASSWLCQRCIASLPPLEAGFCPYCAEPAAFPLLPIAPCLHCAQKRPLWEGIFFYSSYAGLLRNAIVSLKFRGQTYLAAPLAALLLQKYPLMLAEIDCIIPIPLHSSRLLERGYNQSALLAKALHKQAPLYSHKHNRPLVNSTVLKRTVKTRSQVGLTRDERKKNTSGIFTASSWVQGKRVLLVDDVFTTGATVHSATKTLLAAGAASVFVCVAGRMSRHAPFSM